MGVDAGLVYGMEKVWQFKGLFSSPRKVVWKVTLSSGKCGVILFSTVATCEVCAFYKTTNCVYIAIDSRAFLSITENII